MLIVWCRMLQGMHKEVLKYTIPQCMHALLPKMLQEVPVCSPRHLWQQAGLSLLQQLEDQGRWTQVPLIHLPPLFTLAPPFLVYFLTNNNY